MSHVWAAAGDGAQTVAAKGAPEAVMDLCHLEVAQKARVAEVVDELAAEGLRVLAVALGGFVGKDWPTDEHGFDFTFVGLLGLADPVRAEVPAAIADCRAAGIRVVMITGDYPLTARAIAHQAGLSELDDDVLTGDEIAALDDAALRERIADVRVCARIAPAQKLRIVQALKARGDIVAKTGDGVNDAPALRAAHVGVAMGGRGTDVARESASSGIVGAVGSDNRSYGNTIEGRASGIGVFEIEGSPSSINRGHWSRSSRTRSAQRSTVPSCSSASAKAGWALSTWPSSAG